MSTTATDKAVALVTLACGPMSAPCPHCGGGFWYREGEPIAVVHDTECPDADDE
jgi:hypothetical protein